MNKTVKRLLQGDWDNHILPFFWQHGEDEAVLRHYMHVIHDAGCGAVCVESRPHPDFCGPKWWADMDAILDEARQRNMKVWILDDSHFPTGYANGAVESAPEALCRQSVCVNAVKPDTSAHTVELTLKDLIPPPFTPNMMEQYVLPRLGTPRAYTDDSILHVSAFCAETKQSIDLMSFVTDGVLTWQKPSGDWTVYVCGLSRNVGPHRNYINMLKAPSVKLLLDAVYEPHYARYKADFGKTIAGFFSDEPELGNGHLYARDNPLGTDQDLPFSDQMPAALAERLGEDWAGKLYLLWENTADPAETARVRYAYMDAVTKLVRDDFSFQLGDWCRAHGVEYIGHMVEDGGSHARTAAGLGHFFRGLQGQDMSGIDDIGGQVYPQGEDDEGPDRMGQRRDNELFHFLLGRMASSAAAIEPLKKGRAMCEIFGNYGWAEGVKLEKYLADHFMVRGVNYFVPHAFSPKAFPDPDCPPHFYAHGHNPQYRHFGEIIRYMNRICTLTSSGIRAADVALLYHAEAEWAGDCMPSHKPARVLEEHQISFDVIPCDVFAEPERYNTAFGNPLRVNTQTYQALVIPYAQFIPAVLAEAAAKLRADGLPIIFLDALPEGICDGDNALLDNLRDCAPIPLTGLTDRLSDIRETTVSPASPYLRILHSIADADIYYLVNEAATAYVGTVTVPTTGTCFAYNAWDNRIEALTAETVDGGTCLHVNIEPLKSLVVVFGDADGQAIHNPLSERGTALPLSDWTRATCAGIDYPRFGEAKAVQLPDPLAEEQPEFSGFVRYTAHFTADRTEGLTLVISDASEGVEVFLNGQSLGIQVAPPFRYDLSKTAKAGDNELVIEVATTLERQCYPLIDGMRKMLVSAPSGTSGLSGTVTVFVN